MLLARLQRQRVAGLAVDIDGAPDDAPRHLPHECLAAGHETEIRAAARQRQAQRLAFADGDVGAAVRPTRPAACSNRQRGRIDDGDRQRVIGVRPVGQLVDRLQHAEKIGLRDHQRGEILPCELRQRRGQRVAGLGVVRHFDQFDALVAHDGLHHPAPHRMHRRGSSTRFADLCARTAISTASASADAPS